MSQAIPIIPIILCGGQGSRLWPLSRKSYPKQFLQLTQGGSLLQETIKRVTSLPNILPPIIICNEAHYFLTHEQLQDIGIHPSCLILEPTGKNTAPAITIATLQALTQYGENPLLLVMPADHFISNVENFQKTVIAASQQAENYLVTFGIKPTAPKTGYGYIELGKVINNNFHNVAKFTEKPSLSIAEEYCASGQYLWNSGMFLFYGSTFLHEIKLHAPDIYQTCQKAFTQAIRHDNYMRLIPESFNECPENSIDYAVMEKTSTAAVMSMDCGWADMGDWNSIAEVNHENEQGNVLKGEILVEDVSNCCLYSNNRLIAAIGLHNLVVIETKDAVLIADKRRTQDVKRIVAQLQQLSHQAVNEHHRVRRPWGYYESLIQSDNYVVKHIMIKPGASLALQMHQHHSEHWTVVNGVANVECNQKKFILQNNESTYIAPGSQHRLSNLELTPLHIIEVQIGEYITKEDIFHFDEMHNLSETVN